MTPSVSIWYLWLGAELIQPWFHIPIVMRGCAMAILSFWDQLQESTLLSGAFALLFELVCPIQSATLSSHATTQATIPTVSSVSRNPYTLTLGRKTAQSHCPTYSVSHFRMWTREVLNEAISKRVEGGYLRSVCHKTSVPLFFGLPLSTAPIHRRLHDSTL